MRAEEARHKETITPIAPVKVQRTKQENQNAPLGVKDDLLNEEHSSVAAGPMVAPPKMGEKDADPMFNKPSTNAQKDRDFFMKSEVNDSRTISLGNSAQASTTPASPVSNTDKPGAVKKRTSQLGAMASQTRKKRKSQLADMSAAVTAEAPKLNTLEKSKFDWEMYKGSALKGAAETQKADTMSASERDELEAQTHGGGSGLGDVKGYLHRKEFLDRVHDRMDQKEYEAHLSR
ncbi:hypothetical protein MVES1_001886 [Malassezia vespertilionis]|uniref:uncharacterized protein n=1 Tax=Malassezia vespertilionis TaxID=2020962 RepID=UPI0024B26B18|nr:uncharacterized protein MVES1_001886 [Malassezia vespertilionis]WFD06536.1 hypothetical protein MVES1_001886 [Malassezia vespertilionis]